MLSVFASSLEIYKDIDKELVHLVNKKEDHKKYIYFLKEMYFQKEIYLMKIFASLNVSKSLCVKLT